MWDVLKVFLVRRFFEVIILNTNMRYFNTKQRIELTWSARPSSSRCLALVLWPRARMEVARVWLWWTTRLQWPRWSLKRALQEGWWPRVPLMRPHRSEGRTTGRRPLLLDSAHRPAQTHSPGGSGERCERPDNIQETFPACKEDLWAICLFADEKLIASIIK